MKWDTASWHSGCVCLLHATRKHEERKQNLPNVYTQKSILPKERAEAEQAGCGCPRWCWQGCAREADGACAPRARPVGLLGLQGRKSGCGRTCSGDRSIRHPPETLQQLLRSVEKTGEKVRKRGLTETWPGMQMNGFCNKRWRGSARSSCSYPRLLGHVQYR